MSSVSLGEPGKPGEARSGTETWRTVACTSIAISITTDRASMAIEPWPSVFSQEPEGSDEQKTSAEFIWHRVKRRRKTKVQSGQDETSGQATITSATLKCSPASFVFSRPLTRATRDVRRDARCVSGLSSMTHGLVALSAQTGTATQNAAPIRFTLFRRKCRKLGTLDVACCTAAWPLKPCRSAGLQASCRQYDNGIVALSYDQPNFTRPLGVHMS